MVNLLIKQNKVQINKQYKQLTLHEIVSIYFLNIKNLKSARKVNIIPQIKYTLCTYACMCIYVYIYIFTYIMYLITDDAYL